MTLKLPACLAVVLLALSPLVSSADDHTELFVVVTSPDNQTQGMAMVLANQALNQGADVRVLLCSDGGQLALRDYQPEALKPRDVTPKQLLQNLLNNGVTVEVCAIFLPNSDWTEVDLIEGVGVAAPPDVAAYMLQPRVRYFTF